MKIVYCPVIVLNWSSIQTREGTNRRLSDTKPPPGQIGYIPVYDDLAQLKKDLGNNAVYEEMIILEESDRHRDTDEFN
jgi:hypothetical protein